MKKAILSVLSALSTSIFLSSTVFATTNLGTLSYWESDSNTIRRWNERSINIYCEKLNSNNSFTFLVGIDHGCEQWDDVPGITLSSSANDSYSSAPIQIHGGTMEQVNSYGEFTVTSSHNGITRSFSVPEGTWTYGSISKTGELTNRVVACIIDKDHTPDKYKKTCTHELGHALGWAGHSTVPSDIMYSYGSSVTELTNRDKRHLSQVY